MTLDEFQRIFLISGCTRLIARLASFCLPDPVRPSSSPAGGIPRDLGPYLAMGSLFVLQAVADGSWWRAAWESRPSVSHINLSVHLLWRSLCSPWPVDRPGAPVRPGGPRRGAVWSRSSRLVAGRGRAGRADPLRRVHRRAPGRLGVGHVAADAGAVVPETAFGSVADLVESPITVMWIHRWLALRSRPWLSCRAGCTRAAGRHRRCGAAPTRSSAWSACRSCWGLPP